MRGIILLFLLAPLALAAAEPPADLIFRHGVIHSLDARDRVAEALAVRDGVIIYVGDDRGAAKLAGPDSKIVDLQDRVVLPGLIDSHMHPLQGGAYLLKCSLHYEKLTVAEIQARIQSCLDQQPAAPADAWLEVVDWFQQGVQPPGTVLSSRLLDGLKTARPVMLRSSFGHTTVVNSRGLTLAGIGDRTADPPGGRLGRDGQGHLDGNLEDTAQSLVTRLLPPPTAAENLAAAKAALAALRQQGVTSFLDAAAPEASIAAFAALQRDGLLTARGHFAPLIEPSQATDIGKAVAGVTALARRYDQGPIVAAPAITVRNAKLFLDGVIAAPAFTGAMLAPYRVNRGSDAAPDWRPGDNRGPAVYFPARALRRILITLGQAGIDPHLHADGDGAVHAALDAIQAMRNALPGKDVRPAIAHDEIVAPADFPRFAQLGAIPVLSLQWQKRAPDTIEGLEDYLGPERFRILEPAGLLAAAGARIAFGSDWPVDPLDEWFALKVGVTRQNAPAAGDKYAARLGADPGLTPLAAIRSMTADAAYALHMDDRVGTLEVGKLADFIVLDHDPLRVEPDRIADIKVLRTVVGGKTVYLAP